MTGRALCRGLLLASAIVLVPVPSHAHLLTTGLGPLYDGVFHFALTPEDFLPALALALLAGQRGVRAGRLALFALPSAWFVGGLVGLVVPALHPAPALTTISFLALGGLVAAAARLRTEWVAALAVTVGFLHGNLNGAAMSQAGRGVLGVVGIVAVVFAIVALAAARVASLRAEWARIAVRVAGSWIAAIGLLLLGWSLRSAA